MAYLMVFLAFLDNLAQQPVVSPFAVALGATPLMAGVIVGTFSLANIGGNLVSPLLMARAGGIHFTLRLGFGLVAFFLVVYGFVTSPGWLLVVRVCHGFSAGLLVPTVFTYLSLTGQVGSRMGLAGRAIALAALVGPPWASRTAASLGFPSVFLMVACAFLLARFLVDRLPPVDSSPDRRMNFVGVFKNPALHIAYFAAFTLMFGMGMMGFWFPLQVIALGMPLAHVGLYMGLFGLSAMSVMNQAGHWSTNHSLAITAVGNVIFGCGMALLAIADTAMLLVVGMILSGIGFGLVFPSMNVLVSQSTNEKNRGGAFALFHGFFSLAVFAAPVLGGILNHWVHPFHLVVLVDILGFAVFGRSGYLLLTQSFQKIVE